MTLKEIRQRLEENAQERPGETINQYAERIWKDAPRIAYKNLPKSLQETVRKCYTVDKLRPYLLETYNETDLEAITGGKTDAAISKAIHTAVYLIETWGQQPEFITKKSELETKPEQAAEPFPVLIVAAFMDAFTACTGAKSADIAEAPAIARMPVLPLPTSPLTFLFARVLNAGGAPSRSRTNRSEKIQCLFNQKENIAQYTRKNKGQQQTVTVTDPENTLKGGGKIIGKLFFYLLQRWEAGGYGRQFSFPLQYLVDLNMYSNLDTARTGFKKFMIRQAQIQLSQQVNVTRDGKRQKENVGGVVFYHHRIINNDVTVYVNDQMPFTLLANFFTMFPLFAYGLSTNAFFIVQYVMYLARQNGDALQANNGKFTIKIDSVRQYLELPAPEQVKNFKYKEKIQDPIESALEEIEEAMNKHHDALQEYSFTIEPHYKEDGSINSWLAGDLEIQLQPEYAERFIQIAKKQEAYLREREKEANKAKAKADAGRKPS